MQARVITIDSQDRYYAVAVEYGFDVYESGATYAKRIARCGYKGERGMAWISKFIARRTESKQP